MVTGYNSKKFGPNTSFMGIFLLSKVKNGRNPEKTIKPGEEAYISFVNKISTYA